MKKIIAIIAMAVLTASALSARELSAEQAWSRAAGVRHSGQKMRGATSVTPKLVEIVNTDKGQPAYYIFNTGDCTVFASADDIAAPVLGYIESELTGMNHIPPAMAYMLETYVRQIEWAKSSGVTSTYIASRANDFSPIEPLVKTLWGQDLPYNRLCPIYKGKNAYTGCVATATAQVMNYHKYPSLGTGEISYHWNNGNETLSANLADYPLMWNDMLSTYPDANYGTDTQRNAIANLMKSVGYSLHMDYGDESKGGSSASGADIPNALVDNFHYDVGVRCEYRDLYKSSVWESMIYNELSESRPLVYLGRSSAGGHAFVCDGYGGNGLFHINWGWNGLSDGYFRFSALDPSSLGEGGGGGGYNEYQYAIFGVRLPETGSAPQESYIACLTGIYAECKNNTLTLYPYYTGKTTYLFNNLGRLGGIFSFAIRLISEDDGKEYIVKSSGKEVHDIPTQEYITCINAKVPENLPEGSYKVYPLYRLDNGEWHQIRINVNYKPYVRITKDAAGVSADLESLQPGINIVGAELLTELIIGEDFKIRVDLYNTSDHEEYSDISAVLVDPVDYEFGSDYLDHYMAYMEPHSKKSIEINGTILDFIDAGRYALKIEGSNEGKRWFIPDVEVKSQSTSVIPIPTDMDYTPTYYIDLSGRRVLHNNLVPGVYIKVVGATKEKVLIK